jgi:hypothetical protein
MQADRSCRCSLEIGESVWIDWGCLGNVLYLILGQRLDPTLSKTCPTRGGSQHGDEHDVYGNDLTLYGTGYIIV